MHSCADALREPSDREDSEEGRQIGERQQCDEADAEPNEKASAVSIARAWLIQARAALRSTTVGSARTAKKGAMPATPTSVKQAAMIEITNTDRHSRFCAASSNCQMSRARARNEPVASRALMTQPCFRTREPAGQRGGRTQRRVFALKRSSRAPRRSELERVRAPRGLPSPRRVPERLRARANRRKATARRRHRDQ